MSEGARAVVAAGSRGTGRRVRKSRSARRSELLDAALTLIAAGAPTEGGMSDVAEVAGVSSGLLYHYFPGGRVELVDEVAMRLLDELCERVDAAANLPFSPVARLEHALAALVGHLVETPVAFRLLFTGGSGADPDAAGAPADGAPQLARIRLVSMLASLAASRARSADELLASCTELLDGTVAEIRRCVAGATEPEAAWRSSSRRARRLLAAG